MPQPIFLSNPDITHIEEEAILSAVKSGWVAPAGPDLDAFEKEMAQRIGVESAVALSSGTAGLHLGLLALGVKAGDIVITASMTFAATANAITYTGATPYFVDSERKTGNMDPALLQTALEELKSKGTPAAAVVTVDLLGKAADYTAIEQVCAKHGVPVLSDAAESLGAYHHGSPAGSFGDAAVFSFNGNKIMTTSGGGMLLTNNVDLAAKVRYLSTQARQPVVHYEHTDIGYNYRMSNVLAALGRAQLSRLDHMVSRRRNWRHRYREFFGGYPGIDVFGGEDFEDNCWLTSVIIDPAIVRFTTGDLLNALRDSQIEARPLWKPMHLQPVYQKNPGCITGVSEELFKRGLTLPSGSALKDSEFERILATIASFLDQQA